MFNWTKKTIICFLLRFTFDNVDTERDIEEIYAAQILGQVNLVQDTRYKFLFSRTVSYLSFFYAASLNFAFYLYPFGINVYDF